MNKEVICVYQDCPMCGSKGNKLKKVLISQNMPLRKVSFASDEGKDLIVEALQKGIGTMPFYVMDGKFSTEVEELLESKPKKRVKKARKNAVDR